MLHFNYYYFFFLFYKGQCSNSPASPESFESPESPESYETTDYGTTGFNRFESQGNFLNWQHQFFKDPSEEPVCNLFYYLHPRIQSCISINYLNVHKVHQNAAKNSNCVAQDQQGMSGKAAFLEAIY